LKKRGRGGGKGQPPKLKSNANLNVENEKTWANWKGKDASEYNTGGKGGDRITIGSENLNKNIEREGALKKKDAGTG